MSLYALYFVAVTARNQQRDKGAAVATAAPLSQIKMCLLRLYRARPSQWGPTVPYLGAVTVAKVSTVSSKSGRLRRERTCVESANAYRGIYAAGRGKLRLLGNIGQMHHKTCGGEAIVDVDIVVHEADTHGGAFCAVRGYQQKCGCTIDGVDDLRCG